MLFIFAIVFGMLEYVGLFKNRSVNAIIVLVVGIFSASYAPFTATLQTYLPIAALLFIPLFFIAFLQKLMKKGDEEKKDLTSMVVVFTILLIVASVIGDELVNLLPAGIDRENALALLALVAIGMIFFVIHKTIKEE
ncbi:MAG: hypothetical protein HY832_00220 [Candidatus Aenigmarchaeota archaeon]|nr:hypothetical protein [Candidatus Aenigmarchaeota archaeon]